MQPSRFQRKGTWVVGTLSSLTSGVAGLTDDDVSKYGADEFQKNRAIALLLLATLKLRGDVPNAPCRTPAILSELSYRDDGITSTIT